MKSIQCAICGKQQKTKVLYKQTFKANAINGRTFSARRTPDRQHHRFVKCSNCGLIFSNPILPPEEIIKLYLQSTFDYGTESEYLKKTYGFYLKKTLKNSNRKHIGLLDIGCGNGFFLQEAKNIGVGKVFGVEPGEASVKKAPKWLQKNIKVGILKKNIFNKNNFDIICCFHTLDHIVDPNAFLQIVYSLLKKGGKVLFIVHDTSGLSVKIFGEKSPIFDIEHIYLFNRENLAKLFLKNKFKNIETFSIKNTYPLSYWLRMSPLPKQIKGVILNLLKEVKLADFPLSLNAGNIGIIAEK